ncbi:FixH family protein [Mucilaginibacter sp. UYCu711]|uniref:FixH family protein n=1 Tax=Mucilaginibacter sp. UYCu711 TaxID=3156339 RepID=UPI003D209435
MNWGKGIIGGMLIFMLFIVSMCVYMFLLPEDDYDHEYYEKGLSFNKDYNKEKQVVSDHAQPVIIIKRGIMCMAFTNPVVGTIKFVRASNKYQDKIFKIDSHADALVYLPLKSIEKGKWKLVIDWISNHKAYLYQQDIYIK